MDRVVKPILRGGAWGLAAGLTAATAAVLGPGLRSVAERAIRQSVGVASRVRRGPMGAEWDLQDGPGEEDTDGGS